jgi:hypothetical protein
MPTQRERNRARRGVRRGEEAVGLAKMGAYWQAGLSARETADMIRPVSPTLGVLWDVAADAWLSQGRPPRSLFDAEADDGDACPEQE